MFANTVSNHRTLERIWRRERHLFARLKMVGKAGGPGVVSGSWCALRASRSLAVATGSSSFGWGSPSRRLLLDGVLLAAAIGA